MHYLPRGYLRRGVATASTLAAVIAAGGLLGWAAGTPAAIGRALSTDRDFEQLFPHVAALAAWVGLGWFCVAISLEILGRLPGAVGASCSAIAARVSPRIVRRLAQAAVGLTVLAGPVSTPSAFAAPAIAVPAIAAIATIADVSVDRPLGSGPAAEVSLDRPAGSFVALPPAAPPILTPTAPAAIVAGVPHREAAREGYVVRRGDALWDIAARHLGAGASAADIAREWPRWYATNRSVIGPDANLLRPGELLLPPTHESNVRTP